MKSRILLSLAALAMLAAPVFAQDMFTFQDGVSPSADYAGTQDSYIISWDDGDMEGGSGAAVNMQFRHTEGDRIGQNAGDGSNPDYTENPQNMGANALMEMGDNGGGSVDSKSLLVQFDLGGAIAPERADEVTQARIGLTFSQYRDGNDNPSHTVYVNRVLRPWAEGDGEGDFDGVDTPDNSGAVTWNSTGFELWQAMGAEGPEDIAPTESETFFDADSIGPGDVVWFDVTESARVWIADPSANHGIKLSQEVYPDEFLEPDLELPDGRVVYSGSPVAEPSVWVNGRYVYFTSEHDVLEQRPQLEIYLGGYSAFENFMLYR